MVSKSKISTSGNAGVLVILPSAAIVTVDP